MSFKEDSLAVFKTSAPLSSPAPWGHNGVQISLQCEQFNSYLSEFGILEL